MVKSTGMSLNGESIKNLTMSESNLENIFYGNLEEREQFMKLKLYLIKNFVEPLIYKDFKHVNLNMYNFSYILQKLKSFKELEKKEVEIYTTIVEFVQTSVAQLIHTAHIENNFYKSAGFQHWIGKHELPPIILRAEYEIYNGIFGRPVGFAYDKLILKEIKEIKDKNPGILLKDVEYILNRKFKDTVIEEKFLTNQELDDDGEEIKIEYKIYKKIFKLEHNKYNKQLLEIIELLILNNPTITLAEIKKDIFLNHRYYVSFLIEDVFERDIGAEEYYDSLFGKPAISETYNSQYINLINEIMRKYPNISESEVGLEFEFRQPIWAELLLKNKSLNSILFSNTRFKVKDPNAPPYKNMLKTRIDGRIVI